MKTLIAILICLAVLCAIVGLIYCMASSMMSQAEEKYNNKHKEEN